MSSLLVDFSKGISRKIFPEVGHPWMNTHAHRCRDWGVNKLWVKHLHPWMRGAAVPSGSSSLIGKWMITVINFTPLQQPVIDSAGKLAKCRKPSVCTVCTRNAWNSRSFLQSRSEWALIFWIEAICLNWLAWSPYIPTLDDVVWIVPLPVMVGSCSCTMGLGPIFLFLFFSSQLWYWVFCFLHQFFAMKWNNVCPTAEVRQLRPSSRRHSITFFFFFTNHSVGRFHYGRVWRNGLPTFCGKMLFQVFYPQTSVNLAEMSSLENKWFSIRSFAVS